MATSELIHTSIADIPEDKVLARLLSDFLWGTEFFEHARMPRGMQNRQCVPLDRAPGNPKGDIDALLCDPQHPGHSVAFQVKRIKFGIDQLRNGTPGKLQEYKKLAEQTNRLARMGFWQVYAYVVVVVDAREQNAGKITYDGLSSELRSLVASTITTTPLDERVGLAHLEFNQPMDREPFTVGTHSLHRIRGSQPVEQSEELSRWVAGIFSRP